MYCQLCCVPYHWYCLKDYCRDDDRKNFVCASCIYCAVCGGGDHVSTWSIWVTLTYNVFCHLVVVLL